MNVTPLSPPADVLHDPSRRGYIAELDGWELRWPIGYDLGARWVRPGLFHVHAFCRRSGASVLAFHAARGLPRFDVALPSGERVRVSSSEALATLLVAHGVPALAVDRLDRVARAAFARAVDALGSAALASARHGTADATLS